MGKKCDVRVREDLMAEALAYIGVPYDGKPGGEYERVAILTESGSEIGAYLGGGRWKGFRSTDAAIRAFGAMSNPAFIFKFDNDANGIAFKFIFDDR